MQRREERCVLRTKNRESIGKKGGERTEIGEIFID